MFRTPAHSATRTRPRTRIGLTLVAGIALPLGVAACGGGDDGGAAGSDSSGSDSPSSLDVGAVATCLENRGFTVTREADQDPALVLPEEYQDSIGMIEGLSLGSIGDVKGRGSIGFFTDADSAASEDEAAASMRTDDVLAGVSGAANWNYIVTAGDDPGVKPMIEACLA